jgi:hypothetical protein
MQMKKTALVALMLLGTISYTNAQSETAKQALPTAKFHVGDNAEWKNPSFDDSAWKNLKTDQQWDRQGYSDYDGFGWYRLRFQLPSAMLNASYLKENLLFDMAKIDDADEVYLNGKLIGKTGKFPSDAGGYLGKYDSERRYLVPVNDPALLWDRENVLAVRVYDGSGEGGIYGSTPTLSVVDLIDGLSLSLRLQGDKCLITVDNEAKEMQQGKLVVQVQNTTTRATLVNRTEDLKVKPAGKSVTSIPFAAVNERMRISVSYHDKHTGKIKQKTLVPPYILTPKPSPLPQINGAQVFGIRPNSPFLFKIAASGEKPIHYAVKNLPQGLSVDSKTGIITGALSTAGEHKMTLVATNAKGKAERDFTVKVGSTIALTPPMGWNSWNCWGPSVTDAKVRSSAQALIDKGLIDYGWTYINVDDFWESAERLPDGRIGSNSNFPSMKALGDYLHANGLKYGIYSSPGSRTCGGCLGSLGYEALDARSYADWGVDYLKHDWCSYGGDVYSKEGDNSIYAYMKPYLTMQKPLLAQNRDIVYSLCQYGMRDVWQWARAVDGSCWRTTGDIVDTWESLRSIGFIQQDGLHPYAGPGHWNDPDMLIVGMVGWGEHLHPTRLTTDEQYAHISLWCLLASPLLIGCDISQMDDFTLSLLTNSEVLAVNQDPLGRQAQKIMETGDIQVWAKNMDDGSRAVGLFNLGEADRTYKLDLKSVGFPAVKKIRDLWRQADIPAEKAQEVEIPSHGVVLWRVE